MTTPVSLEKAAEALSALLAIHVPVTGYAVDGTEFEDYGEPTHPETRGHQAVQVCRACQDLVLDSVHALDWGGDCGIDPVTWPCPTAAAALTILNGDTL